MINYKSTRGEREKYTFSEAVLRGIAKDGGLFVPEKIPTCSPQQLKKLVNASYQEISQFVFELFQTDIFPTEIKSIIRKAYGDNFDDKKIAPVVHLKNNHYLLELWHGPTSAFKDMALQIMPSFFSYAAKKHDPSNRYLILVATSGDTGKAALEGYKDKKNISIMVFYPHKHVSQIQELQMQTQEGSNVFVFSMQGNFDDCQRSVKEVFADKDFAKKLFEKHKTVLSSANSINWGRLLPQIVYYFSAYLQMVQMKAISFGEKIDIAVPTGNFGNILAGLYAKRMGLPIQKLICASNTNNVLTEFIQTGVYDVRDRKLVQTPSPSMDILISSNSERLLYLMTENPQKVSQWMQELKEHKKFLVDKKTRMLLQEMFIADWVSNKECLENIKIIFDQTGYVLDPHTSVASVVAERQKNERPMLITSVVHFSKFAPDVSKALLGKEKMGDDFALLDYLQKSVNRIAIPKQIKNLQKKKIRHNIICDAGREAVEDTIMKVIRG